MPHCKLLMLPPDLSVMVPLNAYYEHKRMTRVALRRVAVRQTALSVFQAIGIFSFDRNIFLEHPYAHFDTTEQQFVKEIPTDNPVRCEPTVNKKPESPLVQEDVEAIQDNRVAYAVISNNNSDPSLGCSSAGQEKESNLSNLNTPDYLQQVMMKSDEKMFEFLYKSLDKGQYVINSFFDLSRASTSWL
ncbi:hypothetical protein HHI36_023677 [Cryptolaemus montrouzieri]|uniref:Uncharacterized protein n=1 Tax=Cryptolaemus montrouzieri TaxID=559131 RepID=A0ABD2PHJ0_9CUCU